VHVDLSKSPKPKPLKQTMTKLSPGNSAVFIGGHILKNICNVDAKYSLKPISTTSFPERLSE